MAGDWIKLYRQLRDHKLWREEPFTRGQAWVDLLLMANWRDGYVRIRGARVDLKRGQAAASVRFLAERWQWSTGKVVRFLKELKNDAQIDTVDGSVTQLIAITNYDQYQADGYSDEHTDEYSDDTGATHRRHKEKKKQEQPITNKNQIHGAAGAASSGTDRQPTFFKTDKPTSPADPPATEPTDPPTTPARLRSEDLPLPIALDTTAFRETWREWIRRRRKRRHPADTDTMSDQLRALEPLGSDLAITCLKESLKNGWQGVFPGKFLNGKSHSPTERVGPGQRFKPAAT